MKVVWCPTFGIFNFENLENLFTIFHNVVRTRTKIIYLYLVLTGKLHHGKSGNAGLGDPPEPYFNDLPESGNAVIKRAVNYQPNEMSHFCMVMEKLITQQERDCEAAILNRAHVCSRRNSKVCRFHQRNNVR